MKVLIVDDDVLVAESLERILTANDIEVLGKAYSGNDAFEKYCELSPEIVLMDIRMENGDGLHASELILGFDENAKILLLTTFKDDEYIIKAINIGVKGYILKQDYKSILPALNSISADQSVFVDGILEKIPYILNTNPNSFKNYNLTEKEFEIIKLVSDGLNNQEISEKLFLSLGTIRNNISNILSKLDLRDRTQLAIFYYKNLK